MEKWPYVDDVNEAESAARRAVDDSDCEEIDDDAEEEEGPALQFYISLPSHSRFSRFPALLSLKGRLGSLKKEKEKRENDQLTSGTATMQSKSMTRARIEVATVTN